MDRRSEIREFLTSRRARITPEAVGLPTYGAGRVPGLRREEVAVLAGVSVPYYTRIERGDMSGASDSVLQALARALRLETPSARTCSTSPARRSRASPPRAGAGRRRPSGRASSTSSTRSPARRRSSATAGSTSSPPTRSLLGSWPATLQDEPASVARKLGGR